MFAALLTAGWVTPNGNVAVANLAGASFDEAQVTLLFEVANSRRMVFVGAIVFRLFGDRTFKSVATIAGWTSQAC
jgi:hypothetical protein